MYDRDQNYYGEWGTTQYDTLTDFTSILYDVLPTPSMYYNNDPEIQIGFPFPFFGTNYTSVSLGGGGYMFFGLNWYEVYCFAGQFERHDEIPIFSDWRYRLDTVGKDVIKFEWRNVGIIYDIFSNTPTNHSINFQIWLYEDGVIECRFGDIDLKNTPWYSVTSGFTWPTGETYGPWMMVLRRMIEDEYHYVINDQGNIEFLQSGALGGDIYRAVPENGQYFKYIPKEVVKSSLKVYTAQTFKIIPNPVTDAFHIGLAHPENFAGSDPTIEIYNQLGEKVFSKRINIRDIINISNLPAGFYSASLVNESGIRYSTNIIKK
jgi:hypothetical protein